jgi:hypothetical protein
MHDHHVLDMITERDSRERDVELGNSITSDPSYFCAAQRPPPSGCHTLRVCVFWALTIGYNRSLLQAGPEESSLGCSLWFFHAACGESASRWQCQWQGAAPSKVDHMVVVVVDHMVVVVVGVGCCCQLGCSLQQLCTSVLSVFWLLQWLACVSGGFLLGVCDMAHIGKLPGA